MTAIRKTSLQVAYFQGFTNLTTDLCTSNDRFGFNSPISLNLTFLRRSNNLWWNCSLQILSYQFWKFYLLNVNCLSFSPSQFWIMNYLSYSYLPPCYPLATPLLPACFKASAHHLPFIFPLSSFFLPSSYLLATFLLPTILYIPKDKYAYFFCIFVSWLCKKTNKSFAI